MNFATALSIAATAIKTIHEVAPVVSDVVKDLKIFGVRLIENLTGSELTPEQQKAIEDRLLELHNEFQKPIPPENER